MICHIVTRPDKLPSSLTGPSSTLKLHVKPRPYPFTFTGSVPWLSKLHIVQNGKQRQIFYPMMEGLGELLMTSLADRITVNSGSNCAKFR